MKTMRSGSSKWIRAIWITLLLIAAGAGTAWYLNNSRAQGSQYQTAPVSRGDLTQVVTATGN